VTSRKKGHQQKTVQLAIKLMLTTGIRVGELCAIQIPHMDFETNTVRIHGKGKRERQVYIVGDSFKPPFPK
jgi:integrase/recombinase XerD